MLKEILNTGKLSYKGIRALQICTVLTFTIFIQELLRYPSAGWTGFAVMMIYVGFDHGTTMFRAFHRFWGMILGLITGFFLWLMGHLDYRLLIVVIPITIFFAYFLVGHAYSVPTVFTVNTALIGTGYFGYSKTSTVNTFIYSYTVATIIAFVICILFEYFYSRRYNLMKIFIEDTQHKIIEDLKNLLDLLNHNNSNSTTKWFSACLILNGNLTTVNQLVKNSEFEYSSYKVIGNEFNQFVDQVNKVFIDIKALYSTCFIKRLNTHDYMDLFTQVNNNLSQLEQMINSKDKLFVNKGILNNEV